MTSLGLILALGFVLGMRHATDPDHVIAVTTIVSRQRGIVRAGLIGVVWGLGHTLTIFVVGVAIILFKVAIPTRLGLGMEFSVGLMLILLGVLNLSGAMHALAHRWMRHEAQGGVDHDDLPAVDDGVLERSGGWFVWLRPLLVGIVHGLAGSAAVALLVMATIPAPAEEIAYLLIFGLGTVAGMMLITGLIAVPFRIAAARFGEWNRRIVYASGLLSVCFGLLVSYQTGITGGLFTAHPHWTPQ